MRCLHVACSDDVTLHTHIINLSRHGNVAGQCYTRSVCFTPCDTMVLSAAEDATIRLWRPQKSTTTDASISAGGGRGRHGSAGGGGSRGGSGSGSSSSGGDGGGAAQLSAAALLHTFRGHSADVNVVDCGSTAAAAGVFATGSSDGTARIWDLATGKWTARFSAAKTGGGGGGGAAPSADTAVTGVALSPDSMLLATGGMDGTVRLYDVRSATQAACWEGHSQGVFGVSFSPQGQTVAACSLDGTVSIWDTATRESDRARLTGMLASHSNEAWCCGFSPDGRWLFSGGGDNTVLVHDTRLLSTSWMLSGFRSPVVGISFVRTVTDDSDCFQNSRAR